MTLLELALYFMLLSLISVGGMPSVLPEMQRYVVDVKGWMTPADFIQIFQREVSRFDHIEHDGFRGSAKYTVDQMRQGS